MRVVGWLIFRHSVFPVVKSNRVENAPCDVTREILLNIIHTHQFKIRQKKLRNLFSPSVIFFITKFHVLVIMSKDTRVVFSSYQRNRTVHSFSWTVPSYIFAATELWLWWHKEGFSLKCDLIVTKRTKWFFFHLSSNWFSDNKHKLIFIEYQITPNPHIKRATNYP